MFLPVVLTPDPVKYHISTTIGEAQAGRKNGDPYTLDLLRTGRLSYDNYLKSGKPDIFNSDTLDPTVDPSAGDPVPKPYRPSAAGLTPSNVAEVDYINAELAKHYGMNLSTAYQEALSNTSYQRAVKDMKAAGLNPAVMFGSGHGQGASSGIYASASSSGSGSGSGYRGRSNSSNDKLFSGSAYSAIQAIGGLIGVGLLKRPDGYWIGSQTAKGAMGLMDSISKLLK